MSEPIRYRVDPSLDVPPSRQLTDAILDVVATGAVGPGDKLPTVKGLAAEALVNPNTAAKAYRMLQAEGVLIGRNGLGVFVADGGPAIARAARGASTLVAFERAALEAIRAGNDPEALIRALEAHRVAVLTTGETR